MNQEQIDSGYDKMKETSGTFGVIVFVVSALYLYISRRGLGSLFSLKAILFFSIGIFLASLVLGAFAYYLQRFVAAVISAASGYNPGKVTVAVTGVMSLVLLAVDIYVGYTFTRFAFEWLYGRG